MTNRKTKTFSDDDFCRFLDRVVPPDQSFEHSYCGVFRFRFWHFGDWVEVR